MNKAEELQVLTEKSKIVIDDKTNKRTEKWINKKLIPFLEETAKEGKYSVSYSDTRQYFYTTTAVCVNRSLDCCYFRKNINIDLVQTRLEEMGFYIRKWQCDDDFSVYWDKEHINFN